MVASSVLALNVDQLNDDWQWMLQLFRRVLERGGDTELAQHLPGASEPGDSQFDIADNVPLTQAYSIAFQLLSMAEQSSAAQFRDQVEISDGMEALPALWAGSIRDLLDQGWDAKAIAEHLGDVRVELVLTAHPTEAKRATVLAHHRRLFERFQKRHDENLPPWEREENGRTIESLLGVLWRTGEIYLDKPDLQSERRNVMDYLTKIFPLAIRPLDLRLRQAWRELGLDEALLADPLRLPRLTFGTWVGGDRDGHPLVTPEVTADTLSQLRWGALALLRNELVQLARLISLSAYWLPPPSDFLAVVAAEAERLGAAGKRAIARNPNEPWRQFINLMLAKLPSRERVDAPEEGLAYADAAALIDDLRVLHDSIRACQMPETADHAVAPVMRITQMVGFHLAVLDIRQNSAKHDAAIEQLMAAAGYDDTSFASWDEAKRVEFLSRELTSTRPLAHPDLSAGPDADAVLGALRVVKEHIGEHGPDGIGSLIVSMTRSTSDLLAVYLLAREVGLLQPTADGPVCPLPVVPLFETIDDLERSPQIYDGFLAHPLSQRSMKDDRVGQVMIGYSDSNKDGGILASLVGLRHAQRRLTATGAKHGIRVRFFHGRGGTISRGAGPTHRFIKSQPDNTIQGDIRLTEQGETISQKYAHEATAIYNLELFLAGATRKSLRDLRADDEEHELEPVLVQLAGWARDCYSDLLHQDGFVEFFRTATPIDAIEQSRIGSRPSRRSGKQTLADLRAIPWVFSWGQARCYLSGWYGVGTALEKLHATDPDAIASLIEQLRVWAPLHYLISNVATSVAAVDLEVVKQYASLVEDEALRSKFVDQIESEWRRSKKWVETIYGGSLESQRPNVQRMIRLRGDGLRLLHQQQIALLKRYRSYRRMGEDEQAEKLLPALLLTVNAIASGLGTTG